MAEKPQDTQDDSITEVEAARYDLEDMFKKLLFPQHDKEAGSLQDCLNEWIERTALRLIRENEGTAIDPVMRRWGDAISGNVKVRISVDFHAKEGY